MCNSVAMFSILPLAEDMTEEIGDAIDIILETGSWIAPRPSTSVDFKWAWTLSWCSINDFLPCIRFALMVEGDSAKLGNEGGRMTLLGSSSLFDDLINLEPL